MIQSNSWMSGISDSTPVKDLILPGTHDTATYSKTAYVTPWVQTQVVGGSVYDQLTLGVRSFDLRIKQVEDEFFLYHGNFPVNVKFDEVQQDIQRFLEENPSETVLVTIKNEGEPKIESVGSKSWQQVAYESFARFPINKSIDGNYRSNDLWFDDYKDFKDINSHLGIDSSNDGKIDKLSDGRPLFPDLDPILLSKNGDLTSENRLNYDALQLGDVRGKAIVIARGWPKSTDDINTDKPWGHQIGLDATTKGYGPDDTRGAFVNPSYTTGFLVEDWYSRPNKQEKFQAILNFADPASQYTGEVADTGKGYKFAYISAHDVPISSAADYADVINPQLASSLKSGVLKSLADAGELRGTFFADYILAQEGNYDSYLKTLTNSELSDWLPSLIYTKNKIAEIELSKSTVGLAMTNNLISHSISTSDQSLNLASNAIESTNQALSPGKEFTVAEGENIIINLNSFGFSPGTVFYFKAEQVLFDQQTESDFSILNVTNKANENSLSSITGKLVVGGDNLVTYRVNDDQIPEGVEQYNVQLYSDINLTQKQGLPLTFNITDSKVSSVHFTGGIADFITQLYLDMFERSPDAGGLSYWIKQYDSGISKKAIAAQFLGSDEYHSFVNSNAQFINVLYGTLFARPADASGYKYWLEHISNGESRSDIAFQFLQSQEFINITGLYSGSANAAMQDSMLM